MPDKPFSGPLEQLTDYTWRIPRSYNPGMRVDGIIYASREMIDKVRADQAPEQVANVAHLPGIQKASFAMPDIHWGYGFPIGGVAATDPEEGGVISPGGVGYDINCGVRLVRTNINFRDLDHRLHYRLIEQLFYRVPTGVGRGGKFKFSEAELRHIMREGPAWLVRHRGLGTDDDIEMTEARGCLEGADPDKVSQRALARGHDQCGTLGAGNHFLEVQVVEAIFDDLAARRCGLELGKLVVMIHSGSRGLGYQVCEDNLRRLRTAPEKYGIALPDRQLACAPADSPEGRDYIDAMRAAANFAWANRQLLMVQAREVFADVFGKSWEDLDMHLIYDIAHNIAKFEEHQIATSPPYKGGVGGGGAAGAINGQQASPTYQGGAGGGVTGRGEGAAPPPANLPRKRLWVHRKGATRAFPPGHNEIPERYRDLGQPVIIPGSMGTASWLLVGQPGSMEQTFGTTCHGAGRQMSRKGAVREAKGRDIAKELAARGIIARARTRHELAEEQPAAYKDVDLVVEVVHNAGLSKKVARLRAVGVIKG